MIESSNKYTVSIHCMTYNHAPYIEDAMNGFCMQQTDFPFVAVIIDDASTDGEPEIIRNYLKTHFIMESARQWETDDAHFIEAQHKENGNCTFAVVLLKFNYWQAKKSKEPLMKEWSDTKYIAFCEGDDYWIHPKKLQIQVTALNEHPECSFSGTGFLIDKEGKKEDWTIYGENQEVGVYGIERWGRLSIAKTLTLLMRNSAYYHYLTESSKYKKPKDTYLQYHLFKQGKCAYIPHKMGVYNNNGQGIWNSRTDAQKLKWDMFTMQELYFKNNRDADVYDLYISLLIENIKCREIRTGKFKLMIEGLRESYCVNHSKIIIKTYASNKKQIFKQILKRFKHV